MKRNGRLMTKILEEFEEYSYYETDSPIAAYHIDVLARANWIDAEIVRDNSGRAIHARIKLILKDGYDALDKMRQYRREYQQSDRCEPQRNEDGLTQIDQKEVDLAYKNICDGDVRYEKLLWMLVSGSTVISLLIAKWYADVGNKFGGPLSDMRPICWALCFWGFAMSCLVASHIFSGSAHKRFIKKIYTGNRKKQSGGGWSVATNIANHAAAILYLTGFIFVLNLLFTLTHKGAN